MVKVYLDSEFLQILLNVFAGIGLSLSIGFRIFMPLLFFSIGINREWIAIAEKYQWLGDERVLWILGAAVVIEIIAYYIPFIDSVLHTLSLPLSLIAGAVLMVMLLQELSTVPMWVISLTFGSGSALIGKMISSGLRFLTTFTTAGAGNWILSTLESIKVAIVSLLAMVAPMILFVLIIIFVPYAISKIVKKRKAVSVGT